MKRTFSSLHLGLSIAIFLDIIVEYFVARPALFHASVYQIHVITGALAQYGSVALLFAAFLGRTGLKTTGLTGLLMILFFFQPLLTMLASPIALHAAIGLVSLVVNGNIILLGIKRLQKPKVETSTRVL